jgi:Concanavalin A-like lectin/glucanases superfamily
MLTVIRPSWGTGFAMSAIQSRAPWQWKGLVASYAPFLGIQGQKLYDLSGYGNHGFFTEAAWGVSRFGTAKSFNGVDNHVELSDSPLLSPGAGGFTISAWVYPTVVDSTSRWIWGDYSLSLNALVMMRIDSNNQFQAFFRDEAVNTVTPYAATTVVANTGYYLAAVRDGPSVKIYVNGVEDGSGSNASLVTVTVDDGTHPFIGSHPSGGSVWSGLLDDIRIYNRALSADEVREIHTHPEDMLGLRTRRVGVATSASYEQVNYRWRANDGSLDAP